LCTFYKAPPAPMSAARVAPLSRSPQTKKAALRRPLSSRVYIAAEPLTPPQRCGAPFRAPLGTKRALNGRQTDTIRLRLAPPGAIVPLSGAAPLGLAFDAKAGPRKGARSRGDLGPHRGLKPLFSRAVWP